MKVEKFTIELQEFTDSDFDRFINWIPNEAFMYQFAGPVFAFPVTHQQLFSYIDDKNRKAFKVVLKSSELVIGHAEISKIDFCNKNARLCRILIGDEANRNKGFGREIISQLLEIGFTQLHLHRIDLGVFEFNKAAIKCYKSCGLKIEGLLRDAFLIDGKYHSVYNMSILKSEWEQRV